MDKSDRQRKKDREKRLKKQRKAYVREEKESVKRQRQELKRKKHKHHTSLLSRLFRLFKMSSVNKQDREEGERAKLSRQRREKKIQKYLKGQRQSGRRERKQMRAKTRPMRRKIRQAKIEQAKKDFLDFLKHPIKIRQKGKEEKILLQHIRQDIRKERIQWVTGIPSRVQRSFKYAAERRKARLQFQWLAVAHPLSEFNEQFRKSTYRMMMLKTLLNSLLLFVLAFWVVYISGQMVSILIAKIFSIPAVLYSYRVFWPLYTYSSLYSRQALIVIFGMGPLSSLLIAIAAYRVFLWMRKFHFNFKIFLLWIALHGFNLFFGAYIVGMITRTGFIYTTEWLFYSNVFDVEEIIFLISSIVGLVIIGVYTTRNFILASNSPDIILPKIRFFYILAQIFLPWLLGNGLIYLINFPNNPPEFLLLLVVSGLLVLPAFANFNSMDNKMIKVRRAPINTAWLYLLLTLGMVAFVRIVLFYGISFS